MLGIRSPSYIQRSKSELPTIITTEELLSSLSQDERSLKKTSIFCLFFCDFPMVHLLLAYGSLI